MLKQQFQNELKESMKARNELRTSVLRMLLSAITYYEIQKGGAGYEATDEDALSVIDKQVKQRKDSIEQFTKANRMDLAEKEDKEMNILLKYLPAQLSDEEIKKIVHESILQTKANTPAEIGKVMASVMPKLKGKADGNVVSKIVKESLQ